MIIVVLVLLFFATLLLPIEIRFAKLVYREVVLVWVREVSKAWTE